ncbi:aldolase/citrate lyase family protein [Bacillus tianshenii]|nr:aldolase/citrate lyase family protein [Bacillus tianshenii]
MFKSYLFIPANKQRFIEKAAKIPQVDYRVFDLEDSVLASNIEQSLRLLSEIEIKETDWLRIPLLESGIRQVILSSSRIGISQYVIPKFAGFQEIEGIIEEILTINRDAKVLLLLENARSYIELEKILAAFSQSIHGVSLGLHDFAYDTGMKNDYKLLRHIRMNIMLLARAYGVEPIDVVSTHLRNEKLLTEEIFDGFEMGYRAKFLIHPFQLEVLKSVSFYTEEEVNEYKKVLQYYEENIRGKEALFSYNDRVYEKMHLEEIKRIVRWGKTLYGTNGEIF